MCTTLRLSRVRCGWQEGGKVRCDVLQVLSLLPACFYDHMHLQARQKVTLMLDTAATLQEVIPKPYINPHDAISILRDGHCMRLLPLQRGFEISLYGTCK